VIDKTQNTGEIIAGAAVVGTFIGALAATWRKILPGGKDPKKQSYDEKDLKMLAQRLHACERRMERMDKRLDDVFDLLGEAAISMASAQADIREAKTRLEERRRK
jgi:exonuclease VII small subunit